MVMVNTYTHAFGSLHCSHIISGCTDVDRNHPSITLGYLMLNNIITTNIEQNETVKHTITCGGA